MLYELKVGSVTNAQRAVKVLKRKGYKSNVSRIKNPSKSDGCGYAVKVNTENISAVLHILNNNGINVFGYDSV